MRIRPALVFPLVALGLVGCAAPLRVTEDFSLHVPWQSYERIAIQSRNGAVRLETGSGQEIAIEGKKYVQVHDLAEGDATLARLEIVAEASPTDPHEFVIRLDVPADLQQRSAGAAFNVTVPQAVAAVLKTSNGSVHVQGLQGEIVLTSSNGQIVAKDIEGELHADTSNGAVVVRNLTGACELESSNGGIVIEAQRGGPVTASTSNGNVKANVGPNAGDGVNLHSSNGNILVSFTTPLAANLDLRTSNGRVVTELGDAVLRHVDAGRHAFKAEVNGGGGDVVAVTSNGSVTVSCQ